MHTGSTVAVQRENGHTGCYSDMALKNISADHTR